MSAKLYDLDEDAEGAPRFVVDANDHNLVVARLAEAMRPKQVVIKGDRYGIEPCEDGTINIRWLGTADSACLCLPFKVYPDCPVHGTSVTVSEVEKP